MTKKAAPEGAAIRSQTMKQNKHRLELFLRLYRVPPKGAMWRNGIDVRNR